MRVAIRTALLLGVVLNAMVIPGSDVAFSQGSTATMAPAPLFTAIDLHPSGFEDSHASGTAGGAQVGSGAGPATGGKTHALLWHGSAASVADLNPSGFNDSQATGACGGQQVGYGSPRRYDTHALLWHGSAASVVDLHPSRPVYLAMLGHESGFSYSAVTGASGGQQVGYGIESATSGSHSVPLLWRGSSADVVELQSSELRESYVLGTSGGEQVGYGSVGRHSGPFHALLWRGASASPVDLHPSGFISSRALGASGGQQVGYGAGPATGGQNHALLWRGTSASVMDLHPSGFFFSRALGTNGEEQVGWGDRHALLWRANAGSVMDLHLLLPPGFVISVASDIDATGDIVGTAWGPASGNRYHAFLWRRTKPSTSPRQDTMRC